MLVKLTPGVDLTNILQAAFARSDPIPASHQCLFALLGSAVAKAACKMLVKSTPRVNFINIL